MIESGYIMIADLIDEAIDLGVSVHRTSGRIIPGRLVDVVKTREQLVTDIAKARAQKANDYIADEDCR